MSDEPVVVIRSMLRPFGIEPPILNAIVTMIVAHAKKLPSVKPQSDELSIGDIARSFHRTSLKRQDFIGRAADDLAWNMLLAIFADQTDDRPISVSSACYDSGGAATTALRHLTALHEAGILVRTPDTHDRRRALVRLTHKAYDQMTTLIESFCIERRGMPSAAIETAFPF